MRPQHITAENRRVVIPVEPLRRASMRPQHITAENQLHVSHHHSVTQLQ